MNTERIVMGNLMGNSSGKDLEFGQILDPVTKAYENTLWVGMRLSAEKGITNLVALKQALRVVVARANPADQIELIRNFRKVAEQAISCLVPLTGAEESDEGLAKLQAFQKAYEEKFGWPFLIFSEGPRHRGLSFLKFLGALEARIQNPMPIERQESLLHLHRIAEYRLSLHFERAPDWGYKIWDGCEALSQHSEEPNSLTVTFLSAAHQAVSAQLKQMFLDAGFDEVGIDAIGNVVGRYHGAKEAQSPYLLTGSHYDTVRNGGAFDGRVGIVLPMEFVRKLSSERQRLPFGIELVAFSEEEGVRFPATFLGSSALVGDFQSDWLSLVDTNGVSLQSALSKGGLAACLRDIQTLRRDPKNYLGFVEVHIEQGPVLYKCGLPLGVVTAINGSRRYKLKLVGQASHAGTTPMNDRRDVACAAAEIILFVEKAAGQGSSTVATVGVLQVSNGSINTVPGQCELSLDVRAPEDDDRDFLVEAIFAEISAICKRRQVSFESREVLKIAAAPCDLKLRELWAGAIQDLGLKVFELPSGAGHDAMKMHQTMPQAMLFVRGENNGVSHNPLESTDSDDLQLAFEAFERFCLRLGCQ